MEEERAQVEEIVADIKGIYAKLKTLEKSVKKHGVKKRRSPPKKKKEVPVE